MKLLLLSSNIESILLGFFFTALLFAISIITVIGIKLIYLIIKDKFQPPQTVTPKKHNKKQVKSIEINPEEFDKIIVKKN